MKFTSKCDMKVGDNKYKLDSISDQIGEIFMRLSLLIAMSLLTSPLAWAVSVPPHSPPPVANEELIYVDSIKFRDVQGTVVPPSISKSWKLISVSSGEKSNSNNLWFQDTDGSIYLLQGFTSQNKFFIHENVYKIPAK